MKKKCKDWENNEPILSSAIIRQILRGHCEKLKKCFNYCPYCGKKLEEIRI